MFMSTRILYWGRTPPSHRGPVGFDQQLTHGAPQGMVPRSELLQAQAEAQAGRDEAQAAADSVARLQAQVNDARVEAARLGAEMSGMVPRSSLELARQQAAEAAAQAQAEKARLAQAIQALNDRLGAMEEDKSKLVLALQVRRRACPLGRVAVRSSV